MSKRRGKQHQKGWRSGGIVPAGVCPCDKEALIDCEDGIARCMACFVLKYKGGPG